MKLDVLKFCLVSLILKMGLFFSLIVNFGDFEHLETFSDVHPCDKNKGGCMHVCNQDGPNAKCACNKGWALQKDGKKCIKCEFGSKRSLIQIQGTLCFASP